MDPTFRSAYVLTDNPSIVSEYRVYKSDGTVSRLEVEPQSAYLAPDKLSDGNLES